jgi:hypothetical protein
MPVVRAYSAILIDKFLLKRLIELSDFVYVSGIKFLWRSRFSVVRLKQTFSNGRSNSLIEQNLGNIRFLIVIFTAKRIEFAQAISNFTFFLHEERIGDIHMPHEARSTSTLIFCLDAIITLEYNKCPDMGKSRRIALNDHKKGL